MTGKIHSVVVGGTRGIGRVVVRKFHELGHTISVLGRRSVKESLLSDVSTFMVDLSCPSSVEASVEEILKCNGQVNNIVFLQRFRGPGNDWQGEIAVSLTATRIILEKLKSRFEKPSSVVIVSSHAANFVVTEQPLSYHLGKAAILQMARWYAVNLGPDNVRVNCVTPGIVLKEESKDFYLNNISLQRHFKLVTPLGRMGKAEEVADAILFLCSNQASFITGQDLAVDGGLSLHGHESLSRLVYQTRSDNS